MLKTVIIRKGTIRGQSVMLDADHGLPDGQAVVVGISVLVAEGTDQKTAEELAQELEAEEALTTIYRMRHSGRSIREL